MLMVRFFKTDTGIPRSLHDTGSTQSQKKLIFLPCDPASRPSDPSRVIFGHDNLN